MYKGYCFLEKNGLHTEAVDLSNEEDAMQYILFHYRFYPQVMITDDDDMIVMETKQGEDAFPPQLNDLLKKITVRNE